MRILVLHHHRFSRIRYGDAIDHEAQDVTYAGTPDYLSNLPPGLRCETFAMNAAQDVVEQLAAWMRMQPPFERILARHESMILPAAQLRDTFGIRGMPASQALKFRDKVVMKEAVSSAGLRTPRCVAAHDMTGNGSWAGKTVLKPRDGSASEGVLVFETHSAAFEHVVSQRERDPNFCVGHEAEEFVEGAIWHVDGYMHDGIPVAIQTSRYINTCLAFERGEPMGSVQCDNEALQQWAVQCLHALGSLTLSFHLEAILTPEGPVFMEVAARCGGAFIVDEFEARHGVFLHTLDIASDVEGRLAERLLQGKKDKRYFGDFLFPAHVYGGAACRVEVDDGMLLDPHIVQHSTLSADAPTPKSVTLRTDIMPLSGMVAFDDSAELEAWVRRLFRCTRIIPLATPQPGG